MAVLASIQPTELQRILAAYEESQKTGVDIFKAVLGADQEPTDKADVPLVPDAVTDFVEWAKESKTYRDK